MSVWTAEYCNENEPRLSLCLRGIGSWTCMGRAHPYVFVRPAGQGRGLEAGQASCKCMGFLAFDNEQLELCPTAFKFVFV